MTAVSIIGATLYGNRGAEAMLSVCVRQVLEQYPNADIHLFSYYPEDDRRVLRCNRVQVHSATPFALVAILIPLAMLYRALALFSRPLAQRWSPNSIRALATSNVLLCAAGVSFVDGREKYLAFNIAMLLPAMILGTPVIKISQALGSFDHWLNRTAARVFLARCLRVYARGEVTLKHLTRLAPNATYLARADDAAFLFDPAISISQGCGDELDSQLRRGEQIGSGRTATVGLCPSSVVLVRTRQAGGDYVGLMVQVVEQMTSAGYAVFLFPNAARDRHGNALHNNDLPLIHQIAERLSAEARSATTLFIGALNAADIAVVIRRCDVIGTSRFHAMIMALRLGKPVAVIGWSHKYEEVMRLFGQDDMVIDYRGDTSSITRKLVSLCESATERTLSIQAALPEVVSRSLVQFDFIRKHLQN